MTGARALLQMLEEQQPLDVIAEISPQDVMYRPDRHDHYLRAGRSALRCIAVAMLSAGMHGESQVPAKILDLPCGHGRILRALKAAFPEASFTACDIDLDDVDFCARVFGARPVISKPRGEDLDIGDRFDLIWCGSLMTHLDADHWPGFLGLFERSLAAGGLLVFTTFGSDVERKLRSGENTYTLTEEGVESILRAHDRQGFGYVDYVDEPGGMSLSSPVWVCERLAELPTLRLVNYTEAGWHSGWNSRQDVVACVRIEAGAL